MTRRLVWLALLFYVNLWEWGECGVTEQQAQKSREMIRSVCQPRVKITTEMADGIRQGNFPDDKVLKCYTHCVMELTGIMKKNKVNYEAALKTMEKLLSGDALEENRNSLTKCKDSAVGIKDNCEAGFLVVKCFYNNRNVNKEFPFP
ncbi:general odorant-binding protein 72-like [Bradysia coprophila]|uniref:general odorant-binding protein 72-like n=1 Tax=Bradysia coprophila TaxID=38358 RepID=UPI00187D918F|nr:general odorant-binding protein 72-like [Bradysia coprophila]